MGKHGMTSTFLIVKTSWKTTFAGIAASLGTAMTALDHPAWQMAGKVLLAISIYILGVNSRDRDVSSEDENIK